MKILPIALLAALGGISSCAQVPAITAAVVQDVDCVEAQLQNGTDTFEAIAVACAPLAIDQVVTIVTAELQQEGGPLSASAAKVHHKASGKP
jgi:hypothetical protein